MIKGREAEFQGAMVEVYRRGARRGYRATYFLQMVLDHGGVEAARRLLRARNPQSGLTRLRELGILDSSVEALVLEDRWRTLFTDAERQTARERLEAFGYSP